MFSEQKECEIRRLNVQIDQLGLGIDFSGITTISRGSEKPIGDNATREGRNKNRRVEIRVEPGTKDDEAN